ncbi:hypothetical protein ACA910_000222 [Epithemia clementina (nom. ined.)]
MALRRPPTRIELKTEDIEEYEQLMNERLMVEADAKNKIDSDPSSTSNKNHPRRTPQRRKAAAVKRAERIGLPG